MDQVVTPERLNEGLCPDQFKICVPKSSTLLGKRWEDGARWRRHVKHLKHFYNLEGYVDVEDCSTCDGKPGWRLRGEYAVAHARDVHEKIHRQVLGLDQVSAIDIGFAVWERENLFGDFLAIRVHVNRKQPPEKLARQGLSSFTQPSFLATGQREFGASDARSGAVDSSPFVARSNGEREGARSPELLTNRLGIVPPLATPDQVGDGNLESEDGQVVDCCLPCPDGQEDLLTSANDRKAHIERLFAEDYRQNPKVWQTLSRYPIGGVHTEDFSAYCHLPIEETVRIDQVRLCICGVPIDVINAQYRPAASHLTHPGGDAQRGVFVDKAKRNEELTADEGLLVGRGRVAPLVGGISVGSVTSQAGTLGTIVWDEADGTPCILGNWHVLAGSPSARVGQPIYQPAIFDGGTEDDVIAQLKRWHLGSRGDAALAELNHNRGYAAGQVLGLWTSISGHLAPRLNMEVRKAGRTTGFTEGFVDGIALATNIDYGNGTIRFFRDQFHIAPLVPGIDVSQTGDSGSIVVTSFNPVEQKADLELMQQWLEACCDSHAALTLFKEIPCSLDEYLERCRTLGRGCEPLCDLFRNLDCNLRDLAVCVNRHGGGERVPDACPRCGGAGICTVLGDLGSTDPFVPDHQRLLCYLEFAQAAHRSTSAQIREELTRVTFVEARLSRMYERFCLDHNVNQRAAGFFVELYEEITRDGAFPLNCDELAKLQGLSPKGKTGSLDLCYWLEVTMRVVSAVRARLDSCVKLSAEIRRDLQRWRSRCERVPTAEETFKRLCLALHFCCEAKKPCPSPREFVTCLRDAIRHPDADYGGGPQPTGRRARERYRHDKPKRDFQRWLMRKIREFGVEPDGGELELLKLLNSGLPKSESSIRVLLDKAEELIEHETVRRSQDRTRAYYAVGMIFAGDTPGSPFGEFAVASDISILEKELRFSLFPVFEPRSSFRELRERPGQRQVQRDQKEALDQAIRTLVGLRPGEPGGDSRGGGPQPDPERRQGGSGSGSNTGSGTGG